jgi:hypothetical protein
MKWNSSNSCSAPVGSIDHRCEMVILCCQPTNVKFQLPTPTAQNLEVEQQIWIFGIENQELRMSSCLSSCIRSRLTHQLLERLKSTIPWGKFWQVGIGDWHPCRIVLLNLHVNECLLRVNGRQFWNPGVINYAMISRFCPQLTVFVSHPRIYSLW